MLTCGCTGVSEYVHNGFKVGPNYCPPPAPVAKDWIDAADVRVRKPADDLSRWWTIFSDPTLRLARWLRLPAESLLARGRVPHPGSAGPAGHRRGEHLPANASDDGGQYPQCDQPGDGQQPSYRTAGSASGTTASTSVGSSTFGAVSGGQWKATAPRWKPPWRATTMSWSPSWATWRRTTRSTAPPRRESSTPRRTSPSQRKTLEIAEGEFKAGVVGELDVYQARSTLEQTEAGIRELEIAQRQYANALCTLLGMPTEDLEARLAAGPIPTARSEAAIGVPADLLLRRPDVRRAERQAAAEVRPDRHRGGRILSPRFHHRHARRFGPAVFRSLRAGGPGGQRRPDVHLEHSQLWADPQQRPSAGRQAPGAGGNLSEYRAQRQSRGGERAGAVLRAQQRAKSQAAGVADAAAAVKIALAQYAAGTIDLTRVTLLQQNLVPAEDTLAQAQGEIALGLIQVYRRWAAAGRSALAATGRACARWPRATARRLRRTQRRRPCRLRSRHRNRRVGRAPCVAWSRAPPYLSRIPWWRSLRSNGRVPARRLRPRGELDMRSVCDWPWSSFHRYVGVGEYTLDWGADDPTPGYGDSEWGE